MVTSIPGDPERKQFSKNSTVASLQKFRHYAMLLIGSFALRELEKRKLMVVPSDMFFDMLKETDNTAFMEAKATCSTLTDL